VVDGSRLRVTKKVTAEYPVISRKRRDQGTVVLLLSIRSGRVTSVEIEKSSGHSALDQSARKAVSAWEFDVAGFGDSLTARLSVVFSLTGQK
jgi:protein TonB